MRLSPRFLMPRSLTPRSLTPHSLTPRSPCPQLKSFTRSVHTGAATLAVIPLLHSLIDVLREQCLPLLQKTLRFSGASEPSNERL